jgi:hypothetical protein
LYTRGAKLKKLKWMHTVQCTCKYEYTLMYCVHKCVYSYLQIVENIIFSGEFQYNKKQKQNFFLQFCFCGMTCSTLTQNMFQHWLQSYCTQIPTKQTIIKSECLGLKCIMCLLCWNLETRHYFWVFWLCSWSQSFKLCVIQTTTKNR